MADEGIDHRYAAQFQRGFDPARHPVAAPAVPTAATRDAPVRLPGGPPPTAPRVDEVRAARSAGEAVEPAREIVDVAPADPAPRGVWIEWSLLVGAVVLLVVAAGLFWQSATDLGMYGSASTPTDFAFAQVRTTLPGPFLVGGVTAASVWLVLRALRDRA